jgi:hypothetical protein
MRCAGLLIIICMFAHHSAAQAQRRVDFDFGVRAGFPFNEVFMSVPASPAPAFIVTSFSKPKLAVGPTFGATLDDRLRIEFSAIHKSIDWETQFFSSTGGTTITTFDGRWWEFPLTANLYLRQSGFRPYLGGGIVVSDEISGRTETRFSDPSTGAVSEIGGSFSRNRKTWPAVILDAGVQFKRSNVAIRPEFRFTHQRSERSNQFDFLIGFSFNAP